MESLQIQLSTNVAFSCVCSKHFVNEDFRNPGTGGKLLLKESAIPRRIALMPAVNSTSGSNDCSNRKCNIRSCYLCGKNETEQMSYFR